MSRFRLLYIHRRLVTRQIELLVAAPNARKAEEMGNDLIQRQGERLKAYRLPRVRPC